MSCDYHVFCVTCVERHDFNDANHREELMGVLVKHARAIGALAPLFEDDRMGNLTLGTSYGRIDVSWFARHAEHALVVIDEYNRIVGRCGEMYTCDRCTSRHSCNLERDHDGEHAARVR